MNSYLNLAEAIEITGLNEKTLQRFINAGYIQTREDNELTLLKISDLNKTFGLTVAEPEIAPNSELKIEITNLSESEEQEEAIEAPKAEPKSAYVEIAPNIERQKLDDSILEKVIALQDRLIEDKEAQLNEQQREIKWLRTRIEKLEDQSEKDKILLLSGNQTINRLIELSGQKQGWFGRTLTWLGNKDS